MTIPAQLENRIYAVFKESLRVMPEKLAKETRRGDLEEWDSLGHLSLVNALSEEFNVKISPEDALEMETIEDIQRILSGLLRAV